MIKLDVPKIRNGRWPVVDANTGETVGVLEFNSQVRGIPDSTGTTRRIRLFDKYEGGFDSHEECVAFAKGVQAVLNHMISLPREAVAPSPLSTGSHPHLLEAFEERWMLKAKKVAE
jgi:hypothetical protein